MIGGFRVLENSKKATKEQRDNCLLLEDAKGNCFSVEEKNSA